MYNTVYKKKVRESSDLSKRLLKSVSIVYQTPLRKIHIYLNAVALKASGLENFLKTFI